MAETGAAPESLVETLDRLAQFKNDDFPVVSLYLDARPDEHGRDHYQPFVRKELAARARTWALRTPARESFERDAERIGQYLSREVRPSANGVAIFACSGAGGFFEALQLDAPFEENRLSVSNRPHLYPLARLIDQYPRYAVVVADTKSARIYVFGLGREIARESVESPSLNRTSGGWSQMRYQRHVEKLRKEHARDLVEALERVVAEDRVQHVILGGDDVILPLVREELSQDLAAKVVDTIKLDKKHSSESEILETSMKALREHDAKTDVEKVERLVGEYRAGGLAVVGPDDTLKALQMGQVDELLVSASLDRAPASGLEARKGPEAEGGKPGVPSWEDELVVLARETSARVRFIEDPALLAPVESVGAFLRYRVAPPARNFPGQNKQTPSEKSAGEKQG